VALRGVLDHPKFGALKSLLKLNKYATWACSKLSGTSPRDTERWSRPSTLCCIDASSARSRSCWNRAAIFAASPNRKRAHAFGQSGGYSIQVAVSDAHTLLGMQPEPNTLTAKLVKVDYDRESQARRSKTTLKSMLRLLEDEGTARALLTVDTHQVVGYTAFSKGVEDLLMDDIAGFKHEAFHEEREWRLIVRPRVFLKQGTDNGEDPTLIWSRSKASSQSALSG
jgi:hypothetical protein